MSGLSILGSAWAGSTATGVELCHIANAGFSVHGPQGTVLIDALFREGLPDYQRAGDDLNEKMETGAPPFDDVKFVIASHVHADHFNAGALVRHAKRNSDAHYIVTPRALGPMINAGLPAGAMARVHRVAPANDESLKFERSAIATTVFRISHGKSVSARNFGTLIEIGGVRLFHTGDMEPDSGELAQAGLKNLEVDVAMVPFWVVLSEENRKLMRATFKANTVIPMHVPDREQAWMSDYGGLDGLRRSIESTVPNAMWMTGELACRKFGEAEKGTN